VKSAAHVMLPCTQLRLRTMGAALQRFLAPLRDPRVIRLAELLSAPVDRDT